MDQWVIRHFVSGSGAKLRVGDPMTACGNARYKANLSNYFNGLLTPSAQMSFRKAEYLL